MREMTERTYRRKRVIVRAVTSSETWNSADIAPVADDGAEDANVLYDNKHGKLPSAPLKQEDERPTR